MAQQDEGIMALMGAGAGAQPQMGATPEDPPIDMQAFRRDSYPVVKEAVHDVDPQGFGEMQSLLSSELAGAGDLDPEGLATLLEIVDYINENPEEYPQVRAALISAGQIDEGDFPPEMDVEYFATMEVVLQEALMQQRGQAAEMAQGPVGMMPPQGFAKGGIAEAARLVASRGRHGDTMLAHVTPAEARLLKSRGGSGTINPETGLPEFFLKDIGKAIKGVGKAVGGIVKSVLSSPIGRMAATIGLSLFMPAPLASALVAKGAGGSWKDAFKAAAVSFLASPSSPIAGGVEKLTPFLSGMDAGTAAALRSGLTATGANLVTGSNLKDSVTAGITAGLMTSLQQKQDPAPLEDRLTGAGDGAPVDAVGDIIQQDMSRAGAPVPTEAVQAPTGLSTGLRPPGDALSSSGVDYGLQAPSRAPGADSMFPGGTTVQDALSAGQAQAAPADGGAARPLMSTLGQAARGAGQVLTGNFREGLGNLGTGLGETFMPSGEAGIGRTYGPAAVAGLGALAASGGFEQQPLEESPFAQQMRQPIDVPLSLQRPMQNLPGVLYDDQGNIIGSQPFNPATSPTRDMRPAQVATPGIMSLPQQPNYFSPMVAPMMGTGNVQQPFNTPDMYSGFIQPRRYNTGGVASLAQGGYPRRIGQIDGPGTETSDDIPAMLSDGEFVMTARAVRGAGNGSRREGAKKMYSMMHQLEKNAARG